MTVSKISKIDAYKVVRLCDQTACLLIKVRKTLNKSKQVSPKSRIAFTNVLFVNDRQNIEELCITSDGKVKIF